MSEPPRPHAIAWQAVKDNDEVSVKHLFEQYPDVETWEVPAYGTWLHCAASGGSIEVFEYLLSVGWDLNIENRDDATPLVDAASNNQLGIVRLMLARGAAIGSKTSITNPLYACISGSAMDTHPVHGSGNPPTDRLEIAKLLLDAGLDPALRYDLQAYGEMDALTFAWMFGRKDIARLIAERLANGDSPKVETMLDAADRATGSAT